MTFIAAFLLKYHCFNFLFPEFGFQVLYFSDIVEFCDLSTDPELFSPNVTLL